MVKAPSLRDHYEEVLDEDSYSYVMSKIFPQADWPDLVNLLAALLEMNKTDPQVREDLFSAVGWQTAIATSHGGRIPVRRGDFGEMLAAEAAIAFNGMLVPVRKLRYQIDPNQTLPGCDVVGFLIKDDGSIDDLEFVEAKYRTRPPNDIAVVAHEQLADDRDQGYATTVHFIANRLKEMDTELYDKFMSFLSSRDIKDATNTVALCFDKELWSEKIAEELEDLPDHLPELWLRVFPTERATELIDEVYLKLLWEAIEDE